MKKIILAITALCAAAACFGACNTPSCANNNAAPDKYDALNAKLNLNYSQIDITVTDTFDEDTSLVSTYTIKYEDSGMTVSYSIERFNSIPSIDDASTEVKTTLKGEAVFKDGALVSGDKEIAEGIPETGLVFKAEYFDKIISTDYTFSADVINASGFMGSAITCKNMKVSVNFAEKISDIEITYSTQSGNSVEYKYEFVS